MDKCREQFEEYATRYHGALNMGVVGVVYSNQAVQHDWFLWQQAWQASRQALVVELPATCCRTLVFEIEGTNEVGMEHDEYYGVDDIISVLSDAGIKCT